jgi:hypothetical protein
LPGEEETDDPDDRSLRRSQLAFYKAKPVDRFFSPKTGHLIAPRISWIVPAVIHARSGSTLNDPRKLKRFTAFHRDAASAIARDARAAERNVTHAM